MNGSPPGGGSAKGCDTTTNTAKHPKKPAATGGPDRCKLGPADWENNMPALSLDHWNIYCKDLKATVRFYERYVGLHDGDRPPFPFPGAWLYAGDKPILHIVSETGRKDHGSGAIDHVAINCADIRGTLDQIKKDKVKFEVRKVPARPLQQVFIHDPDGVMIELNFWNEADVAELEGFDPMTNKAGARKKKMVPAE
jgi:catechol 2,3-dioxygenase-like lactoylglutathione lyase family enzyme